MLGIQLTTKNLDKNEFDALVPSDGRIFFLSTENGETTISPVAVEVKRNFLGVFPTYTLRTNLRTNKFSFSDSIIRPLNRTIEALQAVVKNTPRLVWSSAVTEVSKRFYKGLQKIKKEQVKKIHSVYDSVHEEFLENILRRNQKDFRQILSEVLKSTAANTITNILQKHLAMFLAKMRDEEKARSADKEFFSSGALALPVNCRFVYQEGGASVYVIEQAPYIRTITYLETQYRIALPYVVFLATTYKDQFLWLQVLFRTAPLQNEADILMCPGLPNIGNDSYVACFPQPRAANANPAALVEEAIQNYWGSNFNRDLSGFFNAAASQFTELRSFDEWQKSSVGNSQFVLKLKWQSTKQNVRDLARKMLNTALKAHNKKVRLKSSTEVLHEYASTLGERFSRELTEKLYFMVAHSAIDVESLKPAKEQFSKLMDEASQEVKTKLEELFATPFSDTEIENVGKDIRLEFEARIDEICSGDIPGVIGEINQLQQKG